MGKHIYTEEELVRDIEQLALMIRDPQRSGRADSVYGIPRGGTIPAQLLSQALGIKVVTVPGRHTIIVDDIVDSGKTIRPYVEQGLMTVSLHCKPHASPQPTLYVHMIDDWIVYLWEKDEASSITDHIVRLIEFIGDDPNREGLNDTPRRVAESYKELFSGYDLTPSDVLKTFEEADCSEMILLRDIEMYSTCEHHMLPFFGKAHIAYIPKKDTVVGISKLARLLEVYARRLQIQERIGHQVTTALMTELDPLGAACVIEARHFCMTCRGVGKQDSVMVTSSLKGVFFDKPEVRAEFMGLIR